MTENYLSILPPGVLNSVEEMLQTGTAIQAGFKGLRSDGEAVITGSWTGSAANTLNRVWQRWETDFAKHGAEVEHAPDVLARATHQFKRLDEGGGR